jgi:RNA polymerase sigma factor (sigma-70 family)
VRMTSDSEVFWKLLEPEFYRAMMFCRKLTGERDGGDDLFQDALVIALTKFDDLRDRSAFRPWLYRIVVSTFKATVRRPWWKRRIPWSPEAERPLTVRSPVDEHTARRWLNRAFQAVSPEEQTLLTLYEMEDWTVGELAELYGKSESAIKVRLFRARKRMKIALLDFQKKSERQENPDSERRKAEKCTAPKPGSD